MRKLLLTLVVIFGAFTMQVPVACAADLPRQVGGDGSVSVVILTETLSSPYTLFTRSVSLMNVGTGEVVFCADALNDEVVEGRTSPIVNTGEPVYLAAVAHDSTGCTGVPSPNSADVYLVVFNAPDPPILLLVAPPVTP